jgi:hypothetical protein
VRIVDNLSALRPGSETAADFCDGSNCSSVGTKKARRPWQDRQTLLVRGPLPHVTASCRLAHGFRPFAKTMRDNRNV